MKKQKQKSDNKLNEENIRGFKRERAVKYPTQNWRQKRKHFRESVALVSLSPLGVVINACMQYRVVEHCRCTYSYIQLPGRRDRSWQDWGTVGGRRRAVVCCGTQLVLSQSSNPPPPLQTHHPTRLVIQFRTYLRVKARHVTSDVRIEHVFKYTPCIRVFEPFLKLNTFEMNTFNEIR